MMHYVQLLLLIIFSNCGHGYRILGVFPCISLSHQVVFRGLMLALRERGHEVVVVTPNPINGPTLKNYTEIDASYLYDRDLNKFFTDFRTPVSWINVFPEFGQIMVEHTEKIFELPEFKKIYRPDSKEKFDLLIVEVLYYPAVLALGKRFDVPIVGITSLGLTINVQYAIGNPILASHPSIWELGREVLGQLTFWQRLKNFISVWKDIYNYRTTFMSKQQAIVRKYLGKNMPDLAELEKNISLIFTNQQEVISFVRPSHPNVISIGGFHVSKQPNQLPEDLQKKLDNATQGFIYMSLGSNAKSKEMPNEIRNKFVSVFSKLPYTILWKFENDVFLNKPDNVIITKWVPQQAVLAHPNIKAFVYQVGLQSTEETINAGVPVVCMPLFADQYMQAKKMVSLGVGKQLDIYNLKEGELFETIRSVALDKSYKERMLHLRTLVKDKPQDTMEQAIWWTEYVIRNRGSLYLRSSTIDQPWYHRQDMDIIFAISIISVIFLSLTLIVLYRLLFFSFNMYKRLQIINEKKNL